MVLRPESREMQSVYAGGPKRTIGSNVTGVVHSYCRLVGSCGSALQTWSRMIGESERHCSALVAGFGGTIPSEQCS